MQDKQLSLTEKLNCLPYKTINYTLDYLNELQQQGNFEKMIQFGAF